MTDDFKISIEKIQEFQKMSVIENWPGQEFDFASENKEEIITSIKKAFNHNSEEQSGFYAIFKDSECLYIGVGKPVWLRIKSHYYACGHGNETNKRWRDFFHAHKGKVKIYWLAFDIISNPKLGSKIRLVLESILEDRYKPKFLER